MAREGRLAADVSARLESASNMSSSPEGQLRVIQGNKGREKVDPLDVRIVGKPLRLHIREFTAVFALLFTIIAYFQAQHPDRASLTIGLLVAAPIFYLLGIFYSKTSCSSLEGVDDHCRIFGACGELCAPLGSVGNYGYSVWCWTKTYRKEGDGPFLPRSGFYLLGRSDRRHGGFPVA